MFLVFLKYYSLYGYLPVNSGTQFSPFCHGLRRGVSRVFLRVSLTRRHLWSGRIFVCTTVVFGFLGLVEFLFLDRGCLWQGFSLRYMFTPLLNDWCSIINSKRVAYVSCRMVSSLFIAVLLSHLRCLLAFQLLFKLLETRAPKFYTYSSKIIFSNFYIAKTPSKLSTAGPEREHLKAMHCSL